MMIANYFLNRKNCDVIYLEERDYPETLTLANENRLIIVDDFWGQNFSPSIQNKYYGVNPRRPVENFPQSFIIL